LTFADLYPDGGSVGCHGSPTFKAAQREKQAAEFAALPRCRCGLLLPCDDCLPTSAYEHAATRMTAADPTLPPDVSGVSSATMQAKRNKWLREHDKRGGYIVPREGR
jgi:hypothetical protein